MTSRPVIWWMRRDFRLADNPALTAAAGAGPVIPLFIHDEEVGRLGAAPRWRLGLAVERFSRTLSGLGGRAVLRRGAAQEVLLDLIAQTGARAVHWARAHDPLARARDTKVKAALKELGVAAVSHPGHVLHEPWTVETGQGGFYRVYSPFWRAVRDREVGAALPVPAIGWPSSWPGSEAPDGWAMGAGMNRGAAVVQPHLCLGEEAAMARLDRFVEEKIDRYGAERDRLDLDATSGLSEPLAYGEISARTCWHAGRRAMEAGRHGAERFLKELIWRDFAYHLLHHTPHIAERSWRPEWEGFPWTGDGAAAEAWRRGRTGMAVVDAAMREMYVTGRMHNRARMLAASYLTKHLMTHWKVGLDWFADCLVDWDPAANAMGWQWVAGSGPDAAPYFRVFNPETQAAKFDPSGAYRARWLAETSDAPGPDALDFFRAIPRSWRMAPIDPYPDRPLVGAAEGRERALAAYAARGF